MIFFGRSQPHSLSVLEALRARHAVVGVVELSARGAGEPSRARRWLDRLRGRPSLAATARRAGIPFFLLSGPEDAGLRAFLRGLTPDAGAICAFTRLLRTGVLEAFPLGVLNLHPSLLPNYRGPSPTVWEFWNREPTGGVTIHFVDDGEDTGDIVAQEQIFIPEGAAGNAHLARCLAAGARLLDESLAALRDGTVVRRPQRHLRCACRARYINAGEAVVDWSATPIEQVFHFLRGALPLIDLLPAAPFPLRLLDFRASRFERGTPARPPGTYFLRRGKVAMAHAEGHVQLEARIRPFRAVRLLREWAFARARQA